MKSVTKIVVFILLIVILIHISCKKEYSCERCVEKNKPPIANAGADKVLSLPVDSVKIDGSASSDPDGTITSYLWTKLSGPTSFNITTASSALTVVKNLKVGIYQFELKVTDNGGLSAKDTIKVIVDSVVTTNHPPVANAGADQTITIPTNTINLDGSASTDPDNNITEFAWTKISGPPSFNIINANAAQTQVTNLVQGVYQFELKVTDAGGLFSKDVMQVTVIPQPLACDNSNRPQVNAQLIAFGTLSQARTGMAVVSAGNKIVFAGGGAGQPPFASRVDIYDRLTQTWSTAELSVGRHSIAAIGAGNKIFFGGGEIGDGTQPVNTVDVYDASTNTWSTSSLSEPGDKIAAATVGNKVFFAGGDGGIESLWRNQTIDIYDLTTNSWSASLLSEPKELLSAVTANNKIYFAGGTYFQNDPSNKIDVYDNATNSWSTSSMIEGKFRFGAITVADKIYWAGGITGSYNVTYTSCAVEIRDVNTGNSSNQYLFSPATWWIDSGENAVVKDNKIIFFGSRNTANKFDIYDITTNTWSIGILPVNISGASIISVNNTIYVAGGTVNGVLSSQVWKLEF